jgi:hypothetical protein
MFWKQTPLACSVCNDLTYSVHLNTLHNSSNKIFINNKYWSEVDYVDFCNTNTNTFNICYYLQSFEVRFDNQKTHFKLAKMSKMNIFKHLRNKYLK